MHVFCLMWVLGVNEWQLRSLERTMKGEKRTSGEENKEGGGTGMQAPGEQKGPSERRGGTSKWEQEERGECSPDVLEVCSSFSGTDPDPDVSQQLQAKTQPRRNILQGKTRPPGVGGGVGVRGSQVQKEVLSKGLKDTVYTVQKEALRWEGKTVCSGAAGNTTSTSQLSNI